MNPGMAATVPKADPPSAAQEVLQRLHQDTARWLRGEQGRRRLEAGADELNRCLVGGWPVGKVGEVVGPHSSGRTTAALAALAAATRRGEVTAWIDLPDAFDAPSAEAAGVVLERVLWVRVRGVEGAVRAAEIVLEAGGFSLVVADLLEGQKVARGGRRRGGGGGSAGALPVRLARAAQRAGAVVLVLTERPWLGALAGARVWLAGEPRWGGGEGGAPGWLAGLRWQGGVEARVGRGEGRVG